MLKVKKEGVKLGMTHFGSENEVLPNAMQYILPAINLSHLKKMTTDVGIIQFSKLNQPDLDSGYTLDDNARALVAMCMYFKLTRDEAIIEDIRLYFNFILKCHQPTGSFLNYVGPDGGFTEQNQTTGLDDSNGRAVWALGYLSSISDLLPRELVIQSRTLLNKSLNNIGMIRSTRAMAFTIKGLYYSYRATNSHEHLAQVIKFANRLVQMYKHESAENWEWFESYFTYANSILPQAMLYAWMSTKETVYKEIAISSFQFLLSQTFNENGLEVISNENWLNKGEKPGNFSEQPIDVAHSVMTLSKFFDEFKDAEYRVKLETAFNWFLGQNRLHQIIYNPNTGGCYDGLEENHVSLNQGAESTISYLLARLTMEEYQNSKKP